MQAYSYGSFAGRMIVMMVIHWTIISADATLWAQDRAHFVPFDSSRLMNAPDPLPLTTAVAFAKLKFNRPLELTHSGDGTNRVYVVEQHGVIQVFPNRSDVDTTDVFLDLHDVVSRDGNEEGLLGLAFHPQYQENGRFYVYYSTRPRASVVSEFRVSADNANRADRQTERILLEFEQPYGNHNGGSIRFGPDGFLYIGLGDGGAANDPHGNGQNTKSLLGSILRIDVDHTDPGLAYAIPKDNPFAKRQDGTRREIWAYGIRNAWRLSFDRQSGQLWTGDVGQNRYEEVDVIRRGGNYGWNIREGFHPFNTTQTGKPRNLIDPLTEYFRHEGVSITGGLVYRGQRLESYVGAYFYGDYVSGNVWTLRINEDGKVTANRKVAATGFNIAAFGEDEHAEMYICAFDGHIHKFIETDPRATDLAKQFPRKLSQTGLFRDVVNDAPADCVIPYEVNVPLWSDGAIKKRFFALPRGKSVGFDPRNAWQFPVGSVLMKSFYLPVVSISQAKQGSVPDNVPLRRLETRLLIHAADGWRGYTYIWNDAQSDAELLEGTRLVRYTVRSDDIIHPQPWYYPSRSDCMACHTQNAGFVLGPRTRQVNRPMNGPAATNQIDLWRSLGIFTSPPPPAKQLESYPDWETDADNQIEPLARAYMDANCAMCHDRNGIVRAPDLRFDTPLAKAQLLGKPAGQGRLGPDGSRIVDPGNAINSELLHRISRRGPRQMPPLATFQADLTAIHRIMAWIDSIDDGH